MRLWVRRVLGFSLLVLGGCGGSNDSGTPQPKPAVAGCEALTSRWCGKVLDCAIVDGLVPAEQRTPQLDQCNAVARAAAQCAKAVELGPDHKQCMTDIDAAECSPIVEAIRNQKAGTLPTTCTGVIRVQALEPAYEQGVVEPEGAVLSPTRAEYRDAALQTDAELFVSKPQ